MNEGIAMDNRYDICMSKFRLHYYTATYQPPTSEAIDDLEAKIGCKVPEDYRHFLMKYGMTALGAVVYPELRKPDLDGGGVQEFFGINPTEPRDLIRRRSYYLDRIPDHYLAIGVGSAEVICLELVGEKRGAVFIYMPDEFAVDDGDPEKDMHMIWPDFDGFIRNLRPISRPDAYPSPSPPSNSNG